MTAQVSAVGATSGTKSRTKINPYELLRSNGFLDVFSIKGAMDGSVISKISNRSLTPDHLAKLPDLIAALENNDLPVQLNSLKMLRDLLPEVIDPNKTTVIAASTSDTDAEIRIPTPHKTTPTTSSLAMTAGMLAATTGGGARRRELPTSTDPTANKAIQIFYRELNSPGITFVVIDKALVITPEGDSAILDGSLTELFESAVRTVEKELSLKIDRRFLSTDTDSSIRIEKPKAS